MSANKNRIVLLLLMSGLVIGDNCGSFNCPVGYNGIPAPASKDCGGVCDKSMCCVAIVCNNSPSSQLLAAFINGIADVSGCNKVSDSPCLSTCIAGYGSSGPPGIECVAANTWAVTNACTPIICDPWLDAGPNFVVPVTTAQQDACKSAAVSTSCSLTCLTGYSGFPTLSCEGSGSWVVGGVLCRENDCLAFSLPAGMEPSASSSACTISAGTVPEGTLKAVTASECSLQCGAGYTQSGSNLLKCSPSFLTPSTPLTCSEINCNAYTLLTGMIPDVSHPIPCTVVSGTVPSGALRAATKTECGLTCSSGYTVNADANLTCSDSSLNPATTMTCLPNECLGGLTAPINTTGGVAVARGTTGDVLTIGIDSSAHNVVITGNYYCTGVPTVWCESPGPAAFSVTGLACDKKRCMTDFTGWSASNVNAVSTTACSVSGETCTLSCADGYTTSGGAPALTCEGKAGVTEPTGEWKLVNACVPITCLLATVPAAVNNVVMPLNIDSCNTVPEGTCTLSCVDGFKTAATGPPQLKCVAADSWEISSHCVAMCSNSTHDVITGSSGVSTGLSMPATTTCAVGSGFLLKPSSNLISCNVPVTGNPAMPATDCTVEQCCHITCGFAPCSSEDGFALKSSANAIRCQGHTAASCEAATCCTQKTCNALNAPVVTGASVVCGGATAHGEDCVVTPTEGYVCTGTVSCTPASSETSSYASALTCSLAACPANAHAPPVCSCTVGFSGLPTWSGSAWIHTCAAQSCACTGISNSASYSSPLSLCGKTNDVVAIICEAGYVPSSPTTKCDGATLTFTTVTCNANVCLSTQVANSVGHTASGSISGSTGAFTDVVCENGYVGRGTGCPASCRAVCDGQVFNAITCEQRDCPSNSGPPGLCQCNAGYKGTPAWSDTSFTWTHNCLATCALYTCTKNGASLKQPPVDFTCSSTSVASCSDEICCRGGVVSPTSGLVTTEDGGTAAFTITLISQPIATVSIALRSSRPTEATVSAGSVSFNSGDWNVPHTVTVLGASDNIDDGDQDLMIETAACISSDVNYNGLNFDDVAVRNLDNDLRGVVVEPRSGLVTTELGGNAAFTVVLSTQPTHPVSISVTSSDTTEGTVSHDSLLFSSVNWNILRTITVLGVDDNVHDGDISYQVVLGSAESNDTNYANLPVADVAVINTDNDAKGITVKPESGLTVTEQGGTAFFTIVLESEPTSNVVIGLQSSDVTEGVTTVDSVTFTPVSWDTPLTVTVAGVQDSIDDGDVGYVVVTSPAVSADKTYNGLNAADVTVTTIDDDNSGFTVSPTTGIITSEEGGKAFVTIALTSEPVSDVRVTSESSQQNEASVSPGEITFTPGNYVTPQTFTITGVDDTIDDGDVPYTLSMAAFSGDPNYNDNTPPVVSCTNLDNDSAGIDLSPSGTILTTTEQGGSDNFTVVLQTSPTASVTLSFSCDASEGRIEPSTVIFNSRDWNVPRVVTVEGVDDSIDDGDVLHSISTTVATADVKYKGMGLGAIPVKNFDDDTRGISISPNTKLVTTEAGGKDTFEMTLESQPTHDVTVTMLSSNVNEGTISPSSVLFTVASWNVPHTVTVTGVQDTQKDGDVVYRVSTTLVSSSDNTYNGLRVADVTVVNMDDDTPGIIVAPAEGLNVSEDGTSGTMSIQLKSVPASDVTIQLETDVTEATLSRSTIVFNSGNWNVPQAIIVTGNDDFVADGNVTFLVRGRPATSADPNYNGLTGPDVSVTNADNDVASMLVSPTEGLVTSEDGSQAEFTIVLTSEPTADVTIGMQGDATEVVFNPVQLVFSALTWNAPQTITLRGVDDNIVDGDIQHTLIVSQTSADAKYNKQQTVDMIITNKDNDTASVRLSKTELRTTEAGGHDTFTLTLTSIPKSDVTISLESSMPKEGVVSPLEITFAPSQWNTPLTITVTGVDDAIDDGNVTWLLRSTVRSADLSYEGLALATASVMNADDDVRGVTVSPVTGLITTESGNKAFFTVVLSTEPFADVTIGITTSDASEGLIGPDSLVFSPVTWGTLQTVTVTGVDDMIADGNITYSISTNPAQSADGRYDGFNAENVEVTNLDDDVAKILVSQTEGLVTTEAGGTDVFSISLQTQPTSTVSITLTSSDETEGVVSRPLVSFSPGNWNTKQSITITGVDDPLDDQDVEYTIRLSPVLSLDESYDRQTVSDVKVLNTDDDTPGISIEHDGVLETTESGGTAKFTVQLTSRPEAPVVIKLISSKPQEGDLGIASLAFTVGDWNTKRTIVITGVDDMVDDGDIPYTIRTQPAVSEDPKYNGINPADVSVINIDDDTAGVLIDPTSGLETTEKGGETQFSIVLTSEPTAPVVIGLSSGDITECKVSHTVVEFTSSTWNTPFIVTVTGIEDSIEDDDVSVTISTSAATSSDGNYDGLNSDDVIVVNKDDDVAGITFAPHSGLVTSESGDSAKFTVVLNSEPTDNVTLTLESKDSSEGSLSIDKLLFVPTHWNIPQTVTVTGVDDAVHDNDVPYSVGISKVLSSDVLYNGLTVVDVQITNTDNDIASVIVSPTEGLETTEEGRSAEFTIELTSKPSNDVTIWVESDDSTEGVPDPLSITFTPLSWDVKQTITVTGQDDWVNDGDQSYQVRVLAAVSSDMDYNGLDAPDVLLVNRDNETRGIVVSQTSVLTSEAGEVVPFTVKLLSQPLAGVEIRMNSTDTSEGRLSVTSLLFTAADWNISQTVSVTGVQDGVLDGDKTYTINLDVLTHDAEYRQVVLNSVTATNKDMVDECITSGMTCYSAGQECEDTDMAAGSLRDFTCKCAGSATGTARGAMAACVYTDECENNGQMCSTAGQKCVDPNADISSDWQCACVAPLTGTSVTGGLATCVLDECLKSGTVCAAVDQVCNDPNTSPLSLNDWTCTCEQPFVGSAITKQAVCKHNGECTTHHATCSPAGQTCFDTNTQIAGDWRCVCQSPYEGSATAGIALCTYDECLGYGSVCEARGQVCRDSDTTTDGNWECLCQNELETGSAMAMAAECIRDECKQNGVCTAAGQVCRDKNTSPGSLGDWTCQCVSPAVGSAVGKSADCSFSGECIAFGSTCTDAGQTCFDPSSETGDWMCRCVEPYDMTYAVGQPAVCVYDECDVHGATCSNVGQKCFDTNTDPRSLGDWRCMCVVPGIGSAMIKPAQCSYQGECRTFQETCSSAGQACVDSDVPGANNWKCACVAPMTGNAVRAPATCVYDECLTHGKLCNAAGQLCRDPDTSMTSLNDWMCECVSPVQGSARARVASCKYDGECKTRSSVCTSVGQTCTDPSASVNNWQCKCLEPATGQATGKAAGCVFDECSLHDSVCSAASQKCEDPNKDPAVTGDWTCNCVGGLATGTAVAEPATCVLNECVSQGHICKAVGQQCTDLDTSPASTGDWQCTCIAPAKGFAKNSVATCEYAQGTQCSQHASVCTARGQSCHDTTGGGWECTCLSPQKGTAREGAALCTLDECELHGKVCAEFGQECKDPSTGVDATDDWLCRCVGSASDSATMAPAVCQHKGECALRAHICTAAGQSCNDPNENRIGDWECVCLSHLTGKATATVATCILNECGIHESVCATAGQRCTDPNHSPLSTDDWECSCVGSDAVGSAVGKQADCVLDECLQYTSTCNSVGQTCYDPDTSPGKTGDWRCNCIAPSVGTAKAQQAACSHTGECTRFASICTEAGQSCVDPDPNVAGDWQCACLSPFSGRARGRKATCTLDECLEHYPECNKGGQVCYDPSDAVGDWMCMCVSPAVGQAPQKPASCKFEGECDHHAATCLNAGQTCFDPDTTRTDDWVCSCPMPLVGVATARMAQCTHDECITYGSVCADAGQACHDPNKNPESLNDWKCMCIQSTGSAKAAPAVCAYEGECAVHYQTCANAGQACIDPSSVDNDWECVCVAPKTGKATGKPASCLLDECKEYGSVCNVAAQQCIDPNPTPTSVNDWRCECIGSSQGTAVASAASCTYTDACVGDGGALCASAAQVCYATGAAGSGSAWTCACVPPMMGSNAMGVASCVLDECIVNEEVCRSSGQTCRDPNTSPESKNDWICECVEPAVGSSVISAASCTFPGECVLHAAVCTSVGQTCVDPDIIQTGDWQCACVTPALGTATGQPATCELDECIKNKKTCESFNQVCNDPTPLASVLGDWTCKCVGSDASGTAVGKPATCMIDECEQHADVCRRSGQSCNDPNMDPTSLGDWVCGCLGVSTGSAVAKAALCMFSDVCSAQATVCTSLGQACYEENGAWGCQCVHPMSGKALGAGALCKYDECMLHRSKCTAVGQECHDPSPILESTNDWTCICKAPLTGVAVAGVATCAYQGECAANAITCTSVGQDCVDPDVSKQGDWMCVCRAPQTGKPGLAKRASCELDECTVHRDTCAAAGQICVDSSRGVGSISDWLCNCLSPASGNAVASVASCEYPGECVDNAHVCNAVGQACIDPTGVSSDWECACVPPTTGSKQGAPATCVLDECTYHSHICAAKGQECEDVDTSPSALNNWVCKCISPAVGSVVGGPATCTFQGECVQQGDTCSSAGQTCRDLDITRANDWECLCIAPMNGTATAKAAACILDECSIHGHACTSVGQECKDVDTSTTSLNDWVCTCAHPATGSARARAATCTVDECIESSYVCSSASQHCYDPDHSNTGDWMCRCVTPQTGSRVRDVAQCSLDECSTYSEVCRVVGQECIDPDESLDALNNWECRCLGSATGSAVAKPATCTFTGECTMHSATCKNVGQVCVDENKQVDGDWKCQCILPAVGAATGAPASCLLDECVLYGDICTSVGQVCNDPNTQSTTGDWTCSCPGGAGFATASRAVCTINECATEKGIQCISAGQECHDPNIMMDSLDDWSCNCVGSSVGSKLAGVASCQYQGECVAHASICVAQGQTCRDPDLTKTGDWMCVCVEPSYGSPATGGPASCSFDECNVSGKVCSAAGQICTDVTSTTNSLNDWICECSGSGTGIKAAGVATCTYSGECATNWQTCASRGQSCADPSTAMDDWQCGCVHPSVKQVVNDTMICILDECKTAGKVCTDVGQGMLLRGFHYITVCRDPNTDPQSTGDFVCSCTGPGASGTATAHPAECRVDECIENTVCSAAGQQCIDSNVLSSHRGDWMCKCIASGSGSATAEAATCVYSGECATHHAICEASGQACNDPNSQVNGDWECVCISPLTGFAKEGVATCMYDECMTHWKTCHEAGQECVDTNKASSSRDDWTCNCIGSAVGSAVANTATCELGGECKQHASTCLSRNQACLDSSSSLNDWMCQCVAPEAGISAVGSFAHCILDECLTSGAICKASGQVCYDTNMDVNSRNDWRCDCVSPASGSAMGRPAICNEVAECETHAHTCAAVGQSCDDPTGLSRIGDWSCVCIPPAIGTATATTAHCTLDECTIHKTVCESKGQTCKDKNTNADSIGDWVCLCVGVQGSSVASPATCILDECTAPANAQVCNDVGQACMDPNTALDSVDDWKCMCVGSQTGSAVMTAAKCNGGNICDTQTTCAAAGQPCFVAGNTWSCGCVPPQVKLGNENDGTAICRLDECLGHGQTCKDVGQVCSDSNNTADAINDWTCSCVASEGTAIAAAATCVYAANDCTANAHICTASGQSCHDADSTVNGEWSCQCVTPATGSPGSKAPATCTFDECTVHGTVCTKVGQRCTDGNTAEASVNNWYCTCLGNGEGQAKGTPATCVYSGDCSSNAKTCTASGQACRDAGNGWSCDCLAPLSGSAFEAAATCIPANECSVSGQTCTAANQDCVDPSPAMNNWRCVCRAPLTGFATAAVATCTTTPPVVTEIYAKVVLRINMARQALILQKLTFLEAVKNSLGLASDKVFSTSCSFALLLLPADYGEEKFLTAFMTAINKRSAVALTRGNLRISSLVWNAASLAHVGKVLAVASTGNGEVEIVGGTSQQRLQWLNAAAAAESDLSTSQDVLMKPGSLEVTSRTPQEGWTDPYVVSEAYDAVGSTATDVTLRLLTHNASDTGMAARLGEVSAQDKTLTAAGFPLQSATTSPNDCLSSCGDQLCSDDDTRADGSFKCTCAHPLIGEAMNMKAVCEERTATVTVQGGDDDDSSVLGLPTWAAILLVCVLFIVCCILLLVCYKMTARPVEKAVENEVSVREEVQPTPVTPVKTLPSLPLQEEQEQEPSEPLPLPPAKKFQTPESIRTVQDGIPPSFNHNPQSFNPLNTISLAHNPLQTQPSVNSTGWV